MNKTVIRVLGQQEFQVSKDECDKADEILNENTIKNISTMPQIFWCGDNNIHIEKPLTYHKDFCCFTHMVGLPKHPSTGIEEPLTDFQIEFFEEIKKTVTKSEGTNEIDWLRLDHKFHVLKGRQMGFTEIVLRVIQFFCFSRYKGYNVGIIAGTTGQLAIKDLRRFYRLFDNIRYTLDTKQFKGNVIKLVNGTVIEAFKASEEALTGDTKYKCVFMDEAAKWKLIDDTPVFNSVMPLVRSNGADLFLVSTPKGPLKMFYKIYQEPEDFVMLKYDIWRAENNLYTTQQIKNMLHTTKEDPYQEYLCEFTIGENSIFGKVEDEDKEDITLWGDEDKQYNKDKQKDEFEEW